MVDPDEEAKLKYVRERVKKRRAYYTSIITFIWVNILLLVINLVTSPRNLWFYWVTVIWGIVLVAQGIHTFSLKDRFLGDEWEERKVKEEMEKYRKNKNR